MNKEPIRVEICESELLRFNSVEAATAYVCDKLQSAGVPMRLIYNANLGVSALALAGEIKKESDVVRDMRIYTWYPPEPSRWQRFVWWLKRFW